MPIIVKLDLALVKKKMRSKDLAEAIGISEQNLSILKTGKARAMRFSTLESICRTLECQPGDILEYQAAEENLEFEEVIILEEELSPTSSLAPG